ncbi:MAG TPA: hypothetical protein VFZ79_05825 [Acidimicrobiales bacterium]
MTIDTATTTPDAAATAGGGRPARAAIGEVVYRFEGRLGELYPLGLFAEGIRFHNTFEGRVVDGPFAGGRIFGIDKFLLRPDGIGEIVAPEVIDDGVQRIELDVRGYVVPPAGAPVPPLAALLEPGFTFPDADFRVTGSAVARTVAAGHEHLNGTTVVIEGTVNMGTGALDVTAYAVRATGVRA